MAEGWTFADAVDAYSPIVAAGLALVAEIILLVVIRPEMGLSLWMYILGPAILVVLLTPCRHRRFIVTSAGGTFGAGGAALGAFLAVLTGVAIPFLFILALFSLPTLLTFLLALLGHS